MGFFDSLFGISKKENIGAMIPNPPQLSLAGGSVEGLTGGLQDLIGTYQRRSTGEDAFDFIRFIFEPQLNRLNQAFGRGFIGEEGMGSLGRRQGALGSLEADLQRRGLLDSGVSGVLQGQLESQRAASEADLFGQAKVGQRADIDAALANLAQLRPALFEAQNIPNQVAYQNALNNYNAEVARNTATAQQRQMRADQKNQAIMGGIGLGLTGLIGGYGGMTTGAGFGAGAGKALLGFNPFSQSTITAAPQTASQAIDDFQRSRYNFRTGQGNPFLFGA